MKQLAFFAIVVAAGLPLPVHAQTKPAVALEAAMAKEQVDGDLTAAMSAYQRIAADVAAPREVRARALLRMAACQEKLGSLSQNLYRQILREFGDQPAAAQARARLAALRQGQPPAPSSMTQRKIEIPGGSFRPQASDGRRMVYRNDATGELIYSDAAARASRVIFKAPPDDLPDWMPSRDFSMVALHFKKKPDRPAFLALIQIDGKGYRELLRDDEKGTVFGNSGGIMNWSWDNRYLLVNHEPLLEPRQMLVVSTSTGERSSLMAQEDGYFEQCAFSPDGRFVACKVDAEAGTAGSSRIFVLPAQGGEAHLVREEADPYIKLLDWSYDGHYLAIASAYSGKSALHLLPVKDGQASGPPILIQHGVFENAFTTRDGTLVFQKAKPGGLWTIHMTSRDADGRPGSSWQKLERPGENPTNPWPHWSPDSNQMVYTARDMEGEFGNSVVRVRNVVNGRDREIYRTQGHVICVWGARQPKVFCSQWKEFSTILSIMPDSGQVDRVGTLPMPAALIYRSAGDDQALHLWRMNKGRVITSRWEIASGRETIFDETVHDQTPLMVSPDDRWLVRANHRVIEIKPVTGGEWKTVAPTTNIQYAIAPDGKWIFYHGADASGGHALFRVSFAGGVPERLGSFPSPSYFGSMEISPDGRRLLTASYDYDHGFELWALDHFMPAPAKP